MDLSTLSDADLDALAAGDFAKLSGEALSVLSTQPDEPTGVKDQTTIGERVLKGAKDPYEAVGQLVERVVPKGAAEAIDRTLRSADPTGLLKGAAKPGTVDQAVRDSEVSYQAKRGDASGELDLARLTGNVLSPLNLSLAARAPASLPAASGILSRMGVSGGVGGASAGLSTPVVSGEPEDFWSEKGKQVGLGAVGGAAAPVAMGALSRAISPRASTNPQVRMLTERGVEPTIGQTLGGLPNRVEQLATSVPIMGDAIAFARRRSQRQFDTAAINEALGPIGARVTGAGHDAVNDAHQAVSRAYDAAKAQLGHIRLDQQWNQDLSQLRNLSQSLTPPFRRQFDKVLRENVQGRAPQGVMTAETFKRVDSDLGTLAAEWNKKPMAAAKEYGAAIQQLQALLNQQAYRTNPGAARAKDAADAAFARLVTVEDAAGRGINQEGHFTPGQLNQAVRGTDRSARRNVTARGMGGPMQDLGTAGQAVLGNTVPDSGTAGRLAWGAGGLASGAVSPAIPAGLIAGAAAYTPPAQRLLRGLVASRPQAAQPIAGALTRAAPLLAPAAGQTALQLSE